MTISYHTKRTLLQVCYSTDHYMELIVDAEVLDVVTGKREVSVKQYLLNQQDKMTNKN